jgi:hypothetical protein
MLQARINIFLTDAIKSSLKINRRADYEWIACTWEVTPRYLKRSAAP